MNRSILMFFSIILVIGFGALPEKSAQNADKHADLSSLGAYLGVWKNEGISKETKYSKVGKNSAETTCNWSPNHGFLVCDQVVQTPNGKGNDLSIYTYNEKDQTFAFYGLSRENKHVRTPKLTIEGNRWTYQGEFDDQGKNIRVRTINEFISATSVTYRTEYSEDSVNWIVMYEGNSKRLK